MSNVASGYIQNDFCRVCNKPLKKRWYREYRKYCSAECQTAGKIEYNKLNAKKRAEKLAEASKKFVPTKLQEPEMCVEERMDIPISLNCILFDSDSTNEHTARVKIMQKLRELHIPTFSIPMYKEVEMNYVTGRKTEMRKYITIHVTARNFFKLVEHHRNLYLKSGNYVNLHSYRNIIKNFQIFIDYVNSLELIEPKEYKNV